MNGGEITNFFDTSFGGDGASYIELLKRNKMI